VYPSVILDPFTSQRKIHTRRRFSRFHFKGKEHAMSYFSQERRLARPVVSGMAAAIIAAIVASGSVYGEPYVYPNKGQSPEKMENDKMSCYQWAKGQTGVDPMAAPSTTKSSAGRGAAGGAAAGAVIGAISGNAGKGAAIGAASGGIVGGVRKRKHESAQSGARSEYDRAWGACMEGKGYTVK
jgi:hypothetical protein